MHIDVNNAFLSWEALYLMEQGYKYDIRDSYAVIGGDEASRRGIVLAKSTPAKKLGIVTAEPLFHARKKCKVLKVYPPHFDYYKIMHEKLMSLIRYYTPDIEVASIDECYMDFSNIMYLYKDPLLFAKKLQKQIYDELGFTVNIGIANNKLCAKMASDLSKPNKIHTIFDDEIESKMYPLKIEELFGIGRKTSPKLKKIGINSIGDLAGFDENRLKLLFKNQANKMILLAKGIDTSEVISYDIAAKGISHSTTLIKDVNNIKDLYKTVELLVDEVCIELRSTKRCAYVISSFVKTNKFKMISHQRKLNNATDNTLKICVIAKELLNEMDLEDSIRLVGVRVDNLTSNRNCQLSLFDEEKFEHNTLDNTIDSLKKKYGSSVIVSASNKKL